MELIRKLIFFVALVALIGCSQTKQIQTTPIVENRQLDTIAVVAPQDEKEKTYALDTYNPSAKRHIDLLHTKLDLKFDWEKERVMGKADLRLKPYFYPIDEVVLDAVGFDLHKVEMKGRELKYDYDQARLTIYLPKQYTKDETIDLSIDYTAKPTETPAEGSAVITSEQGLFFINPRGEDPNKPQQIWTQGETENNSRWFPTIDKPNERCTQEMLITVDDRFKTLSNGVMLKSTKNNDGTRTDYYKMDLPHAPYLFMLAIGEYAVVKEKWRGKDLAYYVEPEYEEHAKAIFANTPEMLDYFSKILGVEYPWPSYSQVVVRDYVSGAMENTTAVIFGEFVQATTKQLEDNNNDGIVAHEMFHHWFGDMVTCESWANLTLNEGFANYAELLWDEHLYGADGAAHQLMSQRGGYIGSTRQQGVHPLIHFGYSDKESMFDAHSYNKGGQVLHMLRHYVGDEAFFASLKKYLTDNAYSAVEIEDLRLAFEAVTGEDLHWFFDQWFLSAGHPVLNISYDYDADAKKAMVHIVQTQEPEMNPPIFILPLEIDLYVGKSNVQHKKVWMKERKQTFVFPVTENPTLINVDPHKNILCERNEEKTEDAYIHQYMHAKEYLSRREALLKLKDSNHPKAKEVFNSALTDPFWRLRDFAVSNTILEGNEPAEQMIEKMARKEDNAKVKASAITKLASSGNAKYKTLISKAIENERSERVIAAALEALGGLDVDKALIYAKKLESTTNGKLLSAIGGIYALRPSKEQLPFFENALEHIGGYSTFSFMDTYRMVASNISNLDTKKFVTKLAEIAMDEGQSFWAKIGSVKTISDTKNELMTRVAEAGNAEEKGILKGMVDSFEKILKDVKENEPNPQLKAIYTQFN